MKERKRFWVELAELAMEQVANGVEGRQGGDTPVGGGGKVGKGNVS